MSKKLVALLILDGWGDGTRFPGNAIELAHKPNFDSYMDNYPNVDIMACGLDVGLPTGQMGNSEVGHTNIGAGRIVYQDLTRITKSIEDGDFFENETLLEAMKNCKENDSKLHLMGLYSPGGVHSHEDHLFALVEMAKKNGIDKVYLHLFLDGRDVPPTSAKEYVKNGVHRLVDIDNGEIASIVGRYYAMDRDNRWDRVEQAYNLLVLGEGKKANDPVQAIQDSYDEEITDEFVKPIVMVDDNDEPIATIEDDDSVVFINFRPDRAREITRSIVDDDFHEFDRKKEVEVFFVGMTEYAATIENMEIAFKSEELTNTLGEYISNRGLKQLRIAETEKYAHVTFFFNGGVETPNENEDRILIPSPNVATYDLQPEMSAEKVMDAVIEKIEAKEYDIIILNFANPDMVGHTGNLQATIKAIETVDRCLGKVVKAINKVSGKAIITADHGNAEEMSDYITGATMTAHTTNPVPCIVLGQKCKKLREDGRLSDIAPTLLDMMDLEVPKEMTGKSLLVK